MSAVEFAVGDRVRISTDSWIVDSFAHGQIGTVREFAEPHPIGEFVVVEGLEGVENLDYGAGTQVVLASDLTKVEA